MAELQTPSFLENQSVEEIHERMMKYLPSDIDKSEGGHPWNLTMPTAYEGSYFAEFIVMEAIKQIFPRYAQNYADTMEHHAELRGIERKAATYATGEITIEGTPGTEIPANSAFSTASVNEEPAIEFKTVESAIIDVTGKVNVGIKAVEAGTVGNVPAETIILKASKIKGITSVTNKDETTGGTEEETIESLQSRIMDYDSSQGLSFVGSEADYKRWALEVNGTGSAIVISPQDDSGLITIVVTDATGNPANEELRKAVYNHIMRPDAPSERLAPVNGGNIQIVAPDTIVITISVTIEVNNDYTLEYIKKKMLESLQQYLVEATQDGEVRYTRIGSVIAQTEGVEDYKSLLVNGGTDNIAISDLQLPSIKESDLNLTQGVI